MDILLVFCCLIYYLGSFRTHCFKYIKESLFIVLWNRVSIPHSIDEEKLFQNI